MPESTDTHTPIVDAPPAKEPAAKRSRKRKGEVRLASIETLFNDGPTDWTPLLELVGVGLTQNFMGGSQERLEDGTILHVYKHRETRASVHVTADGRAFYFDWDGKTVDDGPYEFVETTRSRLIIAAFRDFPKLYGYDEERHPSLVDRALDYAAHGARIPVDPRYAVAYGRATSAWSDVERLAQELTQEELRDARELRRNDDPFDEERF